jgi:alanine racemase
LHIESQTDSFKGLRDNAMVSRDMKMSVSWTEIDLDALAANVRAFRRHCGGSVEIIAVVKANAYGHGDEMISRAALAAGAVRLAVHRWQEGEALRRAGIDAPMLVMGYTPLSAAAEVAALKLTPTVTTLEFATEFAAAAGGAGTGAGKPPAAAPVHVKLDTGMGRHGLLPEEAVDFIAALKRMPGLRVEGLYSHFATADDQDLSYARKQLALFNQVSAALKQRGLLPPVRHCCNSAAAMVLPEAHFEAVRPGLSLYGMNPFAYGPPPLPLEPVLTLKSRVVRLRTLPAGSAIGYGCTYVTQRPQRVALVPVGYGDGYHRLLSNRAQVLIGGRRADILGRVSMDQIVVDVDHIPGVAMEDEVTLIGSQGDETISAEEVAGWAQTINYEVTTALLPRLARLPRVGKAGKSA